MCLFVVMTKEVVECLEGIRGVGVVGNAVLAGAEQVLQCVDCSFVGLFAQIGAV